MKKVNIVTLGCSKNLVDSEMLATRLKKSGFDVHFDASGSHFDAVVINTCGFIQDAKEESIDMILHYGKARQQGKIGDLIVTGCLAERYKAALIEEIPEADAFFGVNDSEALVQRLGASASEFCVRPRLLSTPSHYAYLKISEGCNRKCSFCAIPSIRGPHVSLPPDVLEADARALVADGVKELILVAQELSFYGHDLRGQFLLPELVSRLSDIENLAWLRLHYAYPVDFPDTLLALMRERPNVCRYLDIPVQHISDSVLKRMHRGHTQGQTLALLERIRREVPGVAIRTSVIVGFPGETAADFEVLCRFVEQFRFERLGAFVYSHEEGTAAHANYPDDVPAELKQERLDTIMAIQQRISSEINESRVGQELKVLIDRKEGGWFVGRTEFDSPEVDNEVLIEGNQLKTGEFYNVRITDSAEFELFGEVKG